MEWTINIITIITGILTIPASTVTIIWFIRDVRKENSKVLRAILDTQKATEEVQKTSLEVQKTSLEVQKTSLEVQKTSVEILERIEEGQRKGFETLAKILERIELNTRPVR